MYKKTGCLGLLCPVLSIKKVINIMRLSALLLFLWIFSISATTYSQEARVSFDLKNTTVNEVLNTIKRQTSYSFWYDITEVDADRKVSVKADQETIEHVLAAIFKGQDLEFRVVDKHIVIVKRTAKSPQPTASQQKKMVLGTITDEMGEPLIGANIIIKGTSIGTVTDVDGKFSLDAPNDAILQISSIGYLQQFITAGLKSELKIILKEDTQALEEVVVIGYGTQKKKDLTSSVSSVKSESFNKGAVMNNPLQLVEGKVAGLNITRASGTDPNAGVNVQLRGVSSVKGSTSPLVVIDGVPGGDLNTVLPQDIESIDVLKDGSAAAIYGTRGTNGVILVTTKRGTAGTLRINYEAQLYTETVAKGLDVLSTEQYKQYGKEHDKTFIDFGHDTDWFDQLVKTPFSHIHNLSMSGGAGQTTYRASLSYKNQEGIVSTKTNRETLNGRIAVTQRTWEDKLRFDMNLAYTNIVSRFTDYGVFEQAIKRNPTEPIYNEDGSFFYPTGSEEFEYNPVARLQNKVSGAEYNRFMGDMRVTLEVIKNLKLSAMGAIKKQSDLTHFYESRTSEGSDERGDSGTAQRKTEAAMDKTFETTIDYSGSTGKHTYSAVVGYSYQDFVYENFEAKNFGFITDAYQWNNLEAGSYLKEGKAEMKSEKKSNKLIAFLGRANYSYDNRYLASVTVRREGSSRFGTDSKWGTFPAVSVGWRMNNEAFMKEIDWLSDLKIRAGYGLTGNQMDENYISIARMGTQKYILHGDTWVNSYGLSTNPNSSLKWEVKKELNVGMDASVFDSRLGFNLDIYERRNTDLLYKVQASVPSLIHGEVWANVGEMKSNGVELVVFGTPIQRNDMNWDVSVNFAYNKSRLTSLSNEQYVSSANYIEFGTLPAPGNLGNAIRLEESGKAGNFYGYKFEGLTEDGKWIFKENKADGKTDNDDKQVIGNGVPKLFAGLNTSFTYKNFDVSLQLKGAFGFDILNTKEMYYGNSSFYPSNLLVSVLDKHKDLNDSPQYSDYYLEKGDYLKLSNLTLGYTFVNKKIKYLRDIRVYLSGDNLLTFTGYSGLDPEIVSNGFETGIDSRNFYPRTRTYTFGVNIGF